MVTRTGLVTQRLCAFHQLGCAKERGIVSRELSDVMQAHMRKQGPGAVDPIGLVRYTSAARWMDINVVRTHVCAGREQLTDNHEAFARARARSPHDALETGTCVCSHHTRSPLYPVVTSSDRYVEQVMQVFGAHKDGQPRI